MKNTKNGTINILFILILLSISHNVFAAEELERQMDWTSWVPLIAIALAIGYGLAAIAYMIGQVIRNTSLLAWSKEELKEVNMSAIIVGIIFLIIVLINSIYDAAVNPQTSGDTPLSVSTNFLNSKTSDLMNVWMHAVSAQMFIDIMAGPPLSLGPAPPEKGGGEQSEEAGEKKQVGIPIPIPPIGILQLGTVNYLPYYGFSLYSFHLQYLSSFILTALAITLSYGVILVFVDKVALPLLLPLGLFLRTFTLTRKLGSTLIAMGVSLYIFFPISILILQQIVSSPYITVPNQPKLVFKCAVNVDPGDLITPLLGPDFSCKTGHMKWCVNCKKLFGKFASLFKIICWLLTIIFWIIYLAIALFKLLHFILAAQVCGGSIVPGLAGLVTILARMDDLGSDIGSYVLDMIPYVGAIAIPIIISPVITFIILITGIRSVSAAIGGEITILGISGLI
jgi:hypothetical protein